MDGKARESLLVNYHSLIEEEEEDVDNAATHINDVSAAGDSEVVMGLRRHTAPMIVVADHQTEEPPREDGDNITDRKIKNGAEPESTATAATSSTSFEDFKSIFSSSDCVICLCPLEGPPNGDEDGVTSSSHLPGKEERERGVVRELTALPCGHVFHSECVWNVTTRQCPTCRMKFYDKTDESEMSQFLERLKKAEEGRGGNTDNKRSHMRRVIVDNPHHWKYITKEKRAEIRAHGSTIEKYVKKKQKLYRTHVANSSEHAKARVDKKLSVEEERIENFEAACSRVKHLGHQATLVLHFRGMATTALAAAASSTATTPVEFSADGRSTPRDSIVPVPQELSRVIPDRSQYISASQMEKFSRYCAFRLKKNLAEEGALLAQVDELRAIRAATRVRRENLRQRLEEAREEEKLARQHKGQAHHLENFAPRGAVLTSNVFDPAHRSSFGTTAPLDCSDPPNTGTTLIGPAVAVAQRVPGTIFASYEEIALEGRGGASSTELTTALPPRLQKTTRVKPTKPTGTPSGCASSSTPSLGMNPALAEVLDLNCCNGASLSEMKKAALSTTGAAGYRPKVGPGAKLLPPGAGGQGKGVVGNPLPKRNRNTFI